MEKENLETYYGLPKKVKFCTRCVISNQRPSSTNEYKHTINTPKETIFFDDEGVCYACRVAEAKEKHIHWKEREEELKDLLSRHRRKEGYYDVIVPGSGGKDSGFQSHILKYKYGMHPLTITWSPHLYTEIGWKNFQNWLHVGGFDNFLFTPDPKVHRLLTRVAFENLLHPFQPFILGQKSFPLKMADKFNIKLIMYGEMPGEYGASVPITEKKFTSAGKITDGHSLNYLDGIKSLDDLYLGGKSAAEIMDKYKLERVHLEPYLPPMLEVLQRKEIEFHYLGYYLKWVPQECYYYAIENTGFQANPERSLGTYSKYDSLDDRIDGFFYFTSYIKFGIGKATTDAVQEIRTHHLTREDGVALVRRFDGEFPEKYAQEIFDYLGITEEYFWEVVDRFRSPHLWQKEEGVWKLRYVVS